MMEKWITIQRLREILPTIIRSEIYVAIHGTQAQHVSWFEVRAKDGYFTYLIWADDQDPAWADYKAIEVYNILNGDDRVHFSGKPFSDYYSSVDQKNMLECLRIGK